jgi:hypothetical protein
VLSLSGELAAHVRVEGADGLHVLRDVARGLHGEGEATALLLVVEEAQHHRHVRGLGDAVEAALPVVALAARARGRDDEVEALGALDRVGDRVDLVAALAAIDRHAAESLHQPAEGRLEEGRLARPADVHVERPRDREREGKVPVRRVWCRDEDGLLGDRHLVGDGPAERAQPRLADEASQRTDARPGVSSG